MKIKILTLFIAAASLASCASFLEEDVFSQIPADKMYKSYSDAEMAVKNAYAPLADDLYSYKLQSIGSYGTDEMLCYYSGRKDLNFVKISDYSLTAGDIHINDVWSGLYRIVFRCNDVYHSIEKMTNISEKGAKELQGEALFLRAFSYFNLVQFWGGVRLNTVEPSFKEATRRDVNRASVEQVYEQIIEDLKFAAEYLPELSKENGRVNKYSAHALIAKVYLTIASSSKYGVAGFGNFDPDEYYALARDNANEVITYADATGNIGLMTNYRDIFSVNHKYNKENLFEVGFTIGGKGADFPQLGGPVAGGNNNPYGFMKSALTGGAVMHPTAYLALHIYGHSTATYDGEKVKKVRSEDARFVHNIGHWRLPATYVYTGNIDADIPEKMAAEEDVQKWSCIKFAMKTPEQTAFDRFSRPVNFPLIRFADVLLTYGESAAMLNMGDKTAYDAVNRVRARARVEGTSPSYLEDWTIGQFGSSEEFTDAVLEERLRELCFEGQRRFDLLRTCRLFSTIENMKETARNFVDPVVDGGTDFTGIRNKMYVTDIYYPMYETNLQPYHILLPIPQYEMNVVNSQGYRQNPGWLPAKIEEEVVEED